MTAGFQEGDTSGMFERGLIIGKFMPVHRGHVHLIETARRQCRRLTVIVGALPDEPIPGLLRWQWVCELFSDVDVRYNPYALSGKDQPEPWTVWAGQTRDLTGGGFDVVFTSERYGEAFARALGAQHVMVDEARRAVPISASQIRQQPYECWNYLPAPVRAYYARRVAVVGAESAGKTTLAVRLAQHYTTVWVPEYGREFVDRKGALPVVEDAPQIARETIRREDALAREANRVLIADTETMHNLILARYHFGVVPEFLAALADERRFDLYLLADIDFPWVGDGLHREGPAMREEFHRQVREELERRGLPYVLISGGVEARVARAAAAIDALLGQPRAR